LNIVEREIGTHISFIQLSLEPERSKDWEMGENPGVPCTCFKRWY